MAHGQAGPLIAAWLAHGTHAGHTASRQVLRGSDSLYQFDTRLTTRHRPATAREPKPPRVAQSQLAPPRPGLLYRRGNRSWFGITRLTALKCRLHSNLRNPRAPVGCRTTPPLGAQSGRASPIRVVSVATSRRRRPPRYAAGRIAEKAGNGEGFNLIAAIGRPIVTVGAFAGRCVPQVGVSQAKEQSDESSRCQYHWLDRVMHAQCRTVVGC